MEFRLVEVKQEVPGNSDHGVGPNHSTAHVKGVECRQSDAIACTHDGEDAPLQRNGSAGASGLNRQFWKAGEYDHIVAQNVKPQNKSGMEHVRVHPKFLHSNATSHKWAFGAIAELLDNAVDEIQNGATFVSINRMINPRDNSPALFVQDNGGGMDPDCIRRCMSLGFSNKRSTSTIGQYGNGFKTSTMRLGADVIVYSYTSRTASIGLLSYTFLRETGHEDTIVPIVDYLREPNDSSLTNPTRLIRGSVEDWEQNLATILQWSPYSTEEELLKHFNHVGPHGTKVIVYNLWLNDEGQPELDFESVKDDIQLRRTLQATNSKPDNLLDQHISNRLRYSLRAYLSVLYLKKPTNFKIFLRGFLVEHLDIGDDLKFAEEILYQPQIDRGRKGSVVTRIGFTKEAPLINVHGFNVYHKNRLILPFWKVYQDNSSRGRGVVGVLEANFIEPAHDKQDFERTALFLRLETRLKQMTVEYWNLHCGLIGYHTPKPHNKPINVLPANNSDPPSSPPIVASAEAAAHQSPENSAPAHQTDCPRVVNSGMQAAPIASCDFPDETVPDIKPNCQLHVSSVGDHNANIVRAERPNVPRIDDTNNSERKRKRSILEIQSSSSEEEEGQIVSSKSQAIRNEIVSHFNVHDILEENRMLREKIVEYEQTESELRTVVAEYERAQAENERALARYQRLQTEDGLIIKGLENELRNIKAENVKLMEDYKSLFRVKQEGYYN
eukprot:Gb_08466 [translate_table: standard]